MYNNPGFVLRVLLEGLAQNLLITLLAAILPLVVGFVFYYVSANNPDTGELMRKILYPFKCIPPILLLPVAYYVLQIPRFWSVVIGLTIPFLGYLASKHREDYSNAKNLLDHGLGLLSALFKWSLCSFIIGVQDLFHVANNMFIHTFRHYHYAIALVVAIIILGALELCRKYVRDHVE